MRDLSPLVPGKDPVAIHVVLGEEHLNLQVGEVAPEVIKVIVIIIFITFYHKIP